MVIDAVLKSGKASAIGTRLAVKQDRAAIGQDQPVPSEQHPVLAERYVRIIFADQPRTLRDEQDTPGRAVIDILGHLGGDLPRNI
jgi:hypothetical protein